VLAALALPHEYAITDAQSRGMGPMLARIGERLADGLKLVQVRDKELPRREEFARAVLQLARQRGAKVLINGGPDIADGVHYTAAQLMHLTERPRTGLAGASCHNAAELQRAMALELDFAVLGPVKPTPSHPGAVTLGWDGFARLVLGTSIPVYAIGGMRHSDLEAAWRAGAHGVAMVSGAWR
jgi:8-oxo-dGTP diphosphatase